MTQINVDLDFFNHPKVVHLESLLKRGACILPLKLWIYTARYHAETGRLTGVSASRIEEHIGWWGKRGEAVAALLDAGFLDEDAGDYVVHDWLEWQGHIAAFRRRGREAAKKRWEKMKGGDDPPPDATSNATSITTSIAPAPLSHSQRSEGGNPPQPPRGGAGEIPSLSEVVAYSEQRRAEGHSFVDPGEFFEHYQAIGWKIEGTTAIRHWRLVFQAWERKRKDKPPSTKHSADPNDFLGEPSS